MDLAEGLQKILREFEVDRNIILDAMDLGYFLIATETDLERLNDHVKTQTQLKNQLESLKNAIEKEIMEYIMNGRSN